MKFSLNQLITIISVLGIVASGCTNNLFSGLGRQSVTTTGPATQPPGANSLFALTAVVQSNSQSGQLEFIGDNSGQIGSFCIPTNPSNPFGPSSCQCKFQFDNQSFLADTTYVEGNMIRCLNTLPATAGAVTASIFVVPANAESSTLTVTGPSFGSGGDLDLKNPNSYKEIKRIQCRNNITIPHATSGTFYDPVQSDQTILTYPLSFYTDSAATTELQRFNRSVSTTGQIARESECATDPENRPYWYNQYLYSSGPDSAGSFLIEPSGTSAFDRSKFFVAKKRAGIFAEPLDVRLAPGVVTSQNIGSTEVPPVGFAVKPSGPNEECPSNSLLPEGFEFGLLHSFRSDEGTRFYVKQMSQVGTKGVDAILCNPGAPNSNGVRIFGDCNPDTVSPQSTGNPQNPGEFQNIPLSLANNTIAVGNPNPQGLVSRVFISSNGGAIANPGIPGSGGAPGAATNACVMFSDDLGAPGASSAGEAGQSTRTDVLAGADEYERITFPSGTNTTGRANFSVGSFPFFLDQQNTSGVNSFQPGAGNTPPGDRNTPREPAGTVEVVNFDQENPRSDVVFVVTPTDVKSADLEPGSTSHLQYVPLRFKTEDPSVGGCNLTNPNNCVPPGTAVNYGLDRRNVSTGEEGAFPLCVVIPESP